jgi:hypothetical protein
VGAAVALLQKYGRNEREMREKMRNDTERKLREMY